MTYCLLPPEAAPHVCDIRRRTVLVPNPAAGADWSVQVPGSEAWRVMSLAAVFSASAFVATRHPRLQVTDQTNVILTAQNSQGPAANAVDTCGAIPGGPQGSNAIGPSVSWGVPDPWIVPMGYVIRTLTSNIDVADQWSAIALDVIFELYRGAGAARRYALWRQAQEGGLPEQRLRSGQGGG